MSLKLWLGKSFVRRRIVVPKTGSTYVWPTTGKPGKPGSHVPGGEYGNDPAVGGACVTLSVRPWAATLEATRALAIIASTIDTASADIRNCMRSARHADMFQPPCSPDPMGVHRRCHANGATGPL